MPRASRSRSRAVDRDRHGRGLRSAVTGPQLPMLRTRMDFFEGCVATAVEYVRELWPAELNGVSFEIAGMPVDEPSVTGTGVGPVGKGGVDRWRVSRRQRRIVLYRVPIERMAHLHRDDEWHRRSFIESCVFRAVAEMLGKDPWDIAPERYRHF